MLETHSTKAVLVGGSNNLGACGLRPQPSVANGSCGYFSAFFQKFTFQTFLV